MYLSRYHHFDAVCYCGNSASEGRIGTSLDVFHLSGVSMNQSSTSLIILWKGERRPKNYFNAVEALWHVINGCLFVMLQLHVTECSSLIHTYIMDLQVDHQQEGDNKTHFFTYWTASVVNSFFLSLF